MAEQSTTELNLLPYQDRDTRLEHGLQIAGPGIGTGTGTLYAFDATAQPPSEYGAIMDRGGSVAAKCRKKQKNVVMCRKVS
jgi:hypothetical protein